MENDVVRMTLRIPPETYRRLEDYSRAVNASSWSQTLRFFTKNFLASPADHPNIELPEGSGNKRQTSVAISREDADKLHDIAEERGVKISYLMLLVIHYGLTGF